jgi:hypothetical protein
VWVGLIWPEWPDEVWGLVFGVEREILGGCFNLLFGSSLKLTGCWRLDFRRCCSLKVLCSSYCNFLFWSKMDECRDFEGRVSQNITSLVALIFVFFFYKNKKNKNKNP